MKKILAISLLSLAVTLAVHGQGQVDFRNSNLTAPSGRFVFDTDGITKLATAAFSAQLYYSTTGVGGTYLPVADPAVPFRNVGAGDGFWNPGATFIRNLPGTVGNQSVNLIVRAWESATGSTFETATGKKNSSIAFAYTTGGDPGNGNPATTAGAMTGFQSFNLLPVPEPTTLALGALGAGALLVRRIRRK